SKAPACAGGAEAARKKRKSHPAPRPGRRGAPRVAMLSPGALQILHAELRIGVLPRLLELPLHPGGVRRLSLALQRLRQSEKGAGIARIPLQVLAEDLFRLGRLPAPQQLPSQRFTRRVEP